MYKIRRLHSNIVLLFSQCHQHHLFLCSLSLNVISNDACFFAGGWLWGQGHIDKPLISAVASVNVCSIFTQVSGSLSWGKFTFNFPSSTHDCDDFAICCAAPKTHSCVSTLAGGGVYIRFQYYESRKKSDRKLSVSVDPKLAHFQLLEDVLMGLKMPTCNIIRRQNIVAHCVPHFFPRSHTQMIIYSWRRKTNLISAKNRHYKCDPLKWLMRGWVAIKD